jgi:hypothetical protein
MHFGSWFSFVARPRKQPQARAQQPTSAGARDFARSQTICRKLAKVAPKDDPAIVAGAIVLFAADVIKGSSADLLQARSYLDGMRVAIDNLLVNAFPPQRQESRARPRRARVGKGGQ